VWLLEFKVRNGQFRDTIVRKVSPLAGKRTSYSATKAYLVSDIQGLFNNLSINIYSRVQPWSFQSQQTRNLTGNMAGCRLSWI
jgi:hypothetical protein